MGGSFLYLGDAAIWIHGAWPTVIRNLLALARLVEMLHHLDVGIVIRANDVGFAHRCREIGRPVFSGLLAHDALDGRVGFQRRGIHSQPLSVQDLLFAIQRKHALKHSDMHFPSCRPPNSTVDPIV